VADHEAVWKALADPTRRGILDLLRDGPRTTSAIVKAFPHLSRFGVMKHLDVLRAADLVATREEGRLRVNTLNSLPIREVCRRWVGLFEELWADQLIRLREDAGGPDGGTGKKSSQPD